MFDRDFKDLLSVFDAHNVEYLIVGGYAVSLHARPRGRKTGTRYISTSEIALRRVGYSWRGCAPNITARGRHGRGMIFRKLAIR